MNPLSTIASTLVVTLALASKLDAYPVDRAFRDALEAPASSDQTPVRAFAIPAGPLGAALREFERVTGVVVAVADPAINAITSPGVRGLFTPEQALRRLLAGTSATARLTSASAATVEFRVGDDSVTVSGAAPALSSPKYPAPLRDTPQTVTIIPRDVFDAQGATSLRDVLRNTPGITLTAGEGGTAPGDNLMIRGFSARNDVFIDGARDSGVTSRDAFNTEAVEVAKGPSSVSAGSGSTGGSVNLVSKTAEPADFTSARVIGGNADYKRATIDLNRRLTDDVAVRLNGMWQDAGVPRRDAVKQRAWGVAPALRLGIGPTSFTLGYQHLHQNNVPDYGLPGSLPDLAVQNGATVDNLDFSNFYGLTSRDRERLDADIATATVQHRFSSSLSLRNLTRYGRNTLDRVVTPPRAATASNSGNDPGFDASVPQIRRTDTKYQFRTDETIVNQTDLASKFRTGALQHDAVVGLEFTRDRQPGYSATDTFADGRPPVTDLFDPDPSQPYRATIVPTGATTNARARSGAAYAFDTLKVDGGRWQLNLAGRYDRADVDYTVTTTAGATSTFGRTDGAFSGRTAVIFKPAARGSVYGAWSTSFNPSSEGRFGITLSDAGLNSQGLPPERSRNVEVGTKWDVGRALSFSAALFNMSKTNAKTTDTSGATVLAGDQSVTGIELSVAGSLAPRWTVFGGLSVMDGRTKASGTAAEVDKQLAYVPKSAFNIWSTYRLGPAFTLGAGAEYTAGYFFDNANTLSSDNASAMQRLTRYWLYNAMATYRVNEHISVQVNGMNLGNARYVERGYRGHFVPGAGRAIQLGPVFRF